MTAPGNPFLSVDPDAAFDAVAHDQLGGPYQVPAELVRLAIAYGATKVDVVCRRGRVVVEAEGTGVPLPILEALSRASGQGGDVARLRALAELEELDASALGWAVGLGPRRLVIRARGQGQMTTLASSGRKGLRFSRSAVLQKDGLVIELTRPRLNFKQARRWLEIACRFSPIPVTVNGSDVRRDLDSGCFRARIFSPLPAVIALGVRLQAPRLWLLRHGVVSTRIGVPGWPPFEAAVEMEGQVKGRASAAQLRQTVAPYLEGLVGRVADLTLKVVPRLPEVAAEHRRRITFSLLKAAEKGVAIEAIRQAPLFEIIDVSGSRWVSLEILQHWPGKLPSAVDRRPAATKVESCYLVLGTREREMVVGLIGRSPASAVIKRSGLRQTIAGPVRALLGLLWGLTGPRPLPGHRLHAGERDLIRALEGALNHGGRPITVALTSGRRRPRRWDHRLVLARERPETRRAVRVVSVNPASVYLVAVALKGSRWKLTPEIRSGWQLSVKLR